MIHSGAVVAAGVSQGRSSTFKFDLKVCIFNFLLSIFFFFLQNWPKQIEHY